MSTQKVGGVACVADFFFFFLLFIFANVYILGIYLVKAVKEHPT